MWNCASNQVNIKNVIQDNISYKRAKCIHVWFLGVLLQMEGLIIILLQTVGLVISFLAIVAQFGQSEDDKYMHCKAIAVVENFTSACITWMAMCSFALFAIVISHYVNF